MRQLLLASTVGAISIFFVVSGAAQTDAKSKEPITKPAADVSSSPDSAKDRDTAAKQGRATRTVKVEHTPKLKAAEQAPGGSYVQVYWQGPNAKGDHIAVTTEGARDRSYPLTYPAYTRDGNPLWVGLGKKVDAGRFEIRYIDGKTKNVLARRTITVSAPKAELSAPQVVEPRKTFEVKWQGPGGYKDYVAIAGRKARLGVDLVRAEVGKGNPAVLKAPGKPGEYVVRYIMGSSQLPAAEMNISVRAGKYPPQQGAPRR